MNGAEVTVIGNITDHPALQYTPNEGKAYLRLTVAGNRYTGPDTPSEPSFFDFTLWDSRAENAAIRLAKGDPVFVRGPLVVRLFDRKDGSKGVNLIIQPARDFHYMSRAATAAAAADGVDETAQADPATPVDAPETGAPPEDPEDAE